MHLLRLPALMSLLLVTGLALSACETAKGVQNDVGKGYHSVKSAFQNFRPFESSGESDMALAADPSMAAPTGIASACPPVRIVPDLNQVHQFTDAAAPSPKQAISSIQLNLVESQCNLAEQSIDITLDFDGRAGPKARARAHDKPSFAYPYFLAITNQQGNIIAKEVFAVTLAYDKGDSVRQRETLRQPLPGVGEGYKILIGFQLSDQELAYNRAVQYQPSAASENKMTTDSEMAGPVIESPVQR